MNEVLEIKIKGLVFITAIYREHRIDDLPYEKVRCWGEGEINLDYVSEAFKERFGIDLPGTISVKLSYVTYNSKSPAKTKRKSGSLVQSLKDDRQSRYRQLLGAMVLRNTIITKRKK